jgi:sigma-B regulation protein RsbU (phosphoserine phosphatase)
MLNGDKKTILLVDDNHLVLEIMDRALSREGFKCFKADSALKGINLLKQQLPDIILSDYEMPEMNGFEFREHLMKDTSLKHIPFIFLTSMTDTSLMARGYELEAVDYILKETPVPVVVSKITNLLHAVSLQHQQSIKELSSVAQALNLRSVPQEAPKLKGFVINFWHKPYQDYPGGDFVDFIVVNPRYTCVILGDVMGKRWGAWFFSFSFLSYIRAAVRLCVFEGEFSTAAILNKINRVVMHDPVLNEVLSTLSMMMIDVEEQSINYAGAGDLPVLYYKKEDESLTTIKSTGLLLGIFEDGSYTENTLKLNSGDELMLITDGIIDFEDKQGKITDYNRFPDTIGHLLGTENSFDRIMKHSFIINKSIEQIDDCSIIHIRKESIL